MPDKILGFILLICAIVGMSIAIYIEKHTPKPPPKQHKVIWIITDKTTVDNRTVDIGLQDDGAVIWRYNLNF